MMHLEPNLDFFEVSEAGLLRMGRWAEHLLTQ